MTGSSYGERDYAFGQLMLTLCTIIDLTQASLADRLGVSRRAVAEWEGGSNYPKVERLKQLLVSGAFLARICRWATTLSIQSDTRELHLILSGTSITRKHQENVKSIVKYGRFTHTKPPCRQRMLLGAMSMAC